MTTEAEREHMNLVASLPCIICRRLGLGESPAEVHHINCKTMGRKENHFRTIPLCFLHHRGGGYGVAVHSGLRAFEERYGAESELLEQTLLDLQMMKSLWI